MVMSPMQWRLFHRLQGQIDRLEFSLEEAARELVEVSEVDSWLTRLVDSIMEWFEGPAMPVLFALAQGTKDGGPAVAAAALRASPKGVAEATSIPLALVARLFAQGKAPPPGVHPPEAVIEPEEFFDLYHPYCSHPQPVGREELVEIAVHCDREDPEVRTDQGARHRA
jgi:hypothetical protein